MPGRPSAASEGGEPPHAPRNSGRELAHPAKYQLRVLKCVVRLLENISTASLSSLKLHCLVVIRVAELNLIFLQKRKPLRGHSLLPRMAGKNLRAE